MQSSRHASHKNVLEEKNFRAHVTLRKAITLHHGESLVGFHSCGHKKKCSSGSW